MSFPNNQGNPAGAIPVYSAPAPASAAGSVGVPPVNSTTTESNHVLKASAGALYNITVTIGASAGWLLLFDATSAPADGAVTPAYWYPVATNGTFGAIAVSWPAVPLKFSTGIVAVFSTTGPFTKTASATAQFSAQVL